MLIKKNYMKWIGISTVLLGSVAITAVATVACSTTTKKDTGDYNIYNQWATDLSKSKEAFDVQTLSWYKNNTASLFVKENVAKMGSQGTIWNYPSPTSDPFSHYFATNIHVVSDALLPAANNTYTLNSGYSFYSSRDAETKVDLSNVSLYHISTQSKPIGTTGRWTGDYSSDFVILKSTTRIFPDANEANFLDSIIEYDWLLNNLTTATFYQCGFPALNESGWPVSSEWVNIKYIWDTSVESSFTPSASTTAFYDENYLDPSNAAGLTIGAESNNRLAKSYAQQILLPELNTLGGSSGSLVSVNYNGSLMLVGIYWGGYGFSTQYGSEFLGGIDLFYTASSYQYGTYGLAPAYNNLKTD